MGEGERNPAEAQGPDPARGQTGYESTAFWLASPKIPDQTPAAGSFCTPGPSKPRVIRVLPGEQPALPLPLALTCFPERHATSWLGFIPCIGSDVALQSVHGTSTDGTEYSKSRMNNTKPESNSLKISSTQRQRGERVLALHTGVLAEEARIQLLFSVSCHSVKLRGRNL